MSSNYILSLVQQQLPGNTILPELHQACGKNKSWFSFCHLLVISVYRIIIVIIIIPLCDILKKYPGSVVPSYSISMVSALRESNPIAFLKDSTPFSRVEVIHESDGFMSQ
jgi:hypothetical protein